MHSGQRVAVETDGLQAVSFAALEDDVPEVEAIADRLRPRYEQLKAHTIALIDSVLAKLNATVDASIDHDVGECARTSHRLAGTAGMFGEDRLGEAARSAERRLLAALRGNRSDYAAALTDLRLSLTRAGEREAGDTIQDRP